MITMQCIGKLCKKFPQLKRIFAGTSSSHIWRRFSEIFSNKSITNWHFFQHLKQQLKKCSKCIIHDFKDYLARCHLAKQNKFWDPKLLYANDFCMNSKWLCYNSIQVFLTVLKVNIHKSRGEVSLIEQDTIEYVS